MMTARDLDCARLSNAVGWFLFGCIIAAGVMSLEAKLLTTWAGLLRPGKANPLHARLTQELGPMPMSATPKGHDGQQYYLIARDPFGQGEVPAAIAQYDVPPAGDPAVISFDVLMLAVAFYWRV